MLVLQYRQIEAAPILGHGQVDVLFVHVLPFQRKRFGFAQPGEQDQLVEDLVDWIVETVHVIAPCLRVFDDRTLTLRVPLICGRCSKPRQGN